MDQKGFAVVGLGNWGEAHVRTYLDHPLSELVAVVDQDSERLKHIADTYSVENAFTDVNEMLALDSVDAVSIATPDFAHCELTLAALDAGKHVMVEKPMATTVEECERMRAKIEETGLMFMVDFHNRWSPPFARMKESIAAGEIGEVQYAYMRLSDTIFVPTELLPWAGRSSINWFLGSHCLDTLMWLFEDEVEKVYSVSRSNVLRNMGIDTPDMFVSVLTFRKGTTAVMENAWILPRTAPNIIDLKTQIIGDKGVLYADTSHHRTLEKYTESEAVYPDVFIHLNTFGKPGGFAIESIRHFIECVAKDETPLVGAAEGERVTRVIKAIEASAAEGTEKKI